MRRPVDPERLERLMEALGRAAPDTGRVYLTGGATAVLHGWRSSTIDVDLVFVPDQDALLRELAQLKERLEINVEISSPAHFLPQLPGWRERCTFIGRRGKLDFFHYDPYAQALSKIERGHEKDLADVRAMLRSGMVERAKLLDLFAAIEDDLYRYPAIHPPSFHRALKEVVGSKG